MISRRPKARFARGRETLLGRAQRCYGYLAGALTKRLLRVAAVSLLFSGGGCSGPEETCTQKGVDDCYADVGCAETQPCRLSAREMNRLCVCLGNLECDQVWFHEYCDSAPYEEDAGCPLCVD